MITRFDRLLPQFGTPDFTWTKEEEAHWAEWRNKMGFYDRPVETSRNRFEEVPRVNIPGVGLESREGGLGGSEYRWYR